VGETGLLLLATNLAMRRRLGSAALGANLRQ
jgi:hypothetical protein